MQNVLLLSFLHKHCLCVFLRMICDLGKNAALSIAADMAEFGIENTGAPAEVMGAVVSWLATDPEAEEWNGRNIEAQFFCHERGLLPGWEGPRPADAPIRYDLSGKILDDLESALRQQQGSGQGSD